MIFQNQKICHWGSLKAQLLTLSNSNTCTNWLERKTAYNRFFCKISSSVYSWKVMCPVSPVILPPSEYSPFASFGGIFSFWSIFMLFLWFLKDMLYWLSSSNLKPDEEALLHFSMPTGFIVPGNFCNECAKIVNLFYYSSPPPPLDR